MPILHDNNLDRAEFMPSFTVLFMNWVITPWEVGLDIFEAGGPAVADCDDFFGAGGMDCDETSI